MALGLPVRQVGLGRSRTGTSCGHGYLQPARASARRREWAQLALRTSESTAYPLEYRKFPYAGHAGEANELSSRLLGVAVAVFDHAMRSQSGPAHAGRFALTARTEYASCLVLDRIEFQGVAN